MLWRDPLSTAERIAHKKGENIMSTTQNTAKVARIRDAINEHNVEKLDHLADELYTADWVYHNPDLADLPPGPTGFKQLIRRMFADMPDQHLTSEDMIAEGDKVVIRWTVRGKDLSQQKPVTLMSLHICRFEDGKFAEEWELVHPVEG
jgi:predicted ester cyclase